MRDGQVARISLYKAFLFAHIARALKAGTLNLEHSYKYRPLDDYLIGKERWQREKDVLLARAALQEFIDPSRVLAELDEALHQQYLVTNRRIAAGTNPYLKAAANGRFRITTPKQDDNRRSRSSRSFRPPASRAAAAGVPPEHPNGGSPRPARDAPVAGPPRRNERSPWIPGGRSWPAAHRPSEAADLARVDHRHRRARRGEGGGDADLHPAGGLEHDEH